MDVLEYLKKKENETKYKESRSQYETKEFQILHKGKQEPRKTE